MYIHTFTRFCESHRRFSSPLFLKYITYSFSLLPLCSRPAFLPLVLRSCCLLCVPWLPCVVWCVLLYSVVSPSVSPSPWLDPCVLPCVVLLPSLVSRQAQDSMTVWADAPRIYPRPCLLLPMCCRVFRCPFRVLSCCLPCVRVCVLPCVVWW